MGLPGCRGDGCCLCDRGGRVERNIQVRVGQLLGDSRRAHQRFGQLGGSADRGFQVVFRAEPGAEVRATGRRPAGRSIGFGPGGGVLAGQREK